VPIFTTCLEEVFWETARLPVKRLVKKLRKLSKLAARPEALPALRSGLRQPPFLLLPLVRRRQAQKLYPGPPRGG
jgi:hypothetical protein